MRPVWFGRDLAEAHMVSGLLDAAEIDNEVHGEFLVGVQFGLPPDASTLPRVVVRDEDWERAREVLLAHTAQQAEAASGEALPSEAGAARDEDDPPPRRPRGWFRGVVLVWLFLWGGLFALGAFLAVRLWPRRRAAPPAPTPPE